MKISELKPLEKNPFKSKGDEQIQQIANSIQNFEKMMSIRPIIYDETNVILGGNKRFFALKMLGYKEIPETWAKQVTDLTEEEKREFIVKDNAHWGSVWDYDLLQEWKVDLSEWGVGAPEWGVEETKTVEDENKYTQKIDTPVYEPKNEKPEISVLYNSDRYKELIQEIENSTAPEDVKTMLKVAASRHIVFNYENMADFYANSDKEVQTLMENSALVIIDLNRAIELGYVKLREEIAAQYGQDYGDEE